MTGKRNRGGQPGNKNAVGNRGGGAPYGNKNAFKHGGYGIYPPRSMKEREYWDKAELKAKVKRAVQYTNMLIMLHKGEITQEQFEWFYPDG